MPLISHGVNSIPVSALLSGFFVFLFLAIILRAFVFGKFRSIPGPWHAKLSKAVLKWYTVTGRRLHYIHALHQRYGPVVQISPQVVDVCDLQAFQEIHKVGGGFLKDRWYQKFRGGETQDVFSVIDPKQHNGKRRLMARPFSNSSLRQNWEDAIIGKVASAVSHIKEEAQGGKVDVYKWWTFLTTDVIGLLAFGESFGMVELGVKTPFINDMDSVKVIGGIRAEFTGLYNILLRLTFGYFDPMGAADARVFNQSVLVMENARNRELRKENIFHGIMEESEKENTPWSKYDAAFEAAGLIVAGSGTTAVTLTYLVWAVLKHPHVQTKLEEEVKSLPNGYRDAELEALPYLNAVIQETLRLYGAAPGSLPRVVPKAGLSVQGYFIPPGTTVNTQAWSLQRDPEIFDSPERFYPERFLNATPQQKSAMAPFGAGSRTCLGLNLAYMEMRHAATLFFRECAGARLHPSTTDDSMAVEHFFLIQPKGGSCNITMG